MGSNNHFHSPEDKSCFMHAAHTPGNGRDVHVEALRTPSRHAFPRCACSSCTLRCMYITINYDISPAATVAKPVFWWIRIAKK